jgi:hypothetical protein
MRNHPLALACLLSLLCSNSIAGDGQAEAVVPQQKCELKPQEPAELCNTAACAERAKRELDAQLECHKKKMAELQIAQGGKP